MFSWRAYQKFDPIFFSVFPLMGQPARLAPPCLSLQADEYRPQCILLCALQGSEVFLCMSHCRNTAPLTHRRPFPVDLAP
ncbi:unnamed protein product, partial [Ectocarpus sp. 4 AP-2014]